MSLDPYQRHPKWAELNLLCSEIERLKSKAEKLREEINKDVFSEPSSSTDSGGKGK